MQDLDDYDNNQTSVNDISISAGMDSFNEVQAQRPPTPKLTSLDSFCNEREEDSRKNEKLNSHNFINKIEVDKEQIFKEKYNINKSDKELIKETLDHFNKRFEDIDRDKERFSKKIDMKKLLRFKNLFKQDKREIERKKNKTHRNVSSKSKKKLKVTSSSKYISKGEPLKKKSTKTRRSVIKGDSSKLAFKKSFKLRKQSENLCQNPQLSIIPKTKNSNKDKSFSDILKDKTDSSRKNIFEESREPINKTDISFTFEQNEQNIDDKQKEERNLFHNDFEIESEVINIRKAQDIKKGPRIEKITKNTINRPGNKRLHTEGCYPENNYTELDESFRFTDKACTSINSEACLCDKFKELASQLNMRFNNKFANYVIAKMTTENEDKSYISHNFTKENDFRCFIKKRRNNDKKFKLLNINLHNYHGKSNKELRGKTSKLNAFKKVFMKSRGEGEIKFSVAKKRDDVLNSFR